MSELFMTESMHQSIVSKQSASKDLLEIQVKAEVVTEEHK